MAEVGVNENDVYKGDIKLFDDDWDGLANASTEGSNANPRKRLCSQHHDYQGFRSPVYYFIHTLTLCCQLTTVPHKGMHARLYVRHGRKNPKPWSNN